MSQEQISDLCANQKKWFAIYTKFRAEKYVLDMLTKKNISAYLPLVKEVKRYASKIKTYEKPLINSYLFVCINRSEYIKVLETEYVFRFLRVGKDLISIPNSEIDLLKRIVGAELEDLSINENWEEGDEVEIIAGSLTGIRGKVLSRTNKKDILIELHHLGIQLKFTIDKQLLSPVRQLVKT